jgi:hypothetical protein
VAATCQFLGDEMWADGFDADRPMQSEITDGEIWDLTRLAVGAVCTSTELEPADAAQVTVTPETVEVALNDVVTIDVENTYGDGSLHLRKLIAPKAAEEFSRPARARSLFHVACTLTGASHPRRSPQSKLRLVSGPGPCTCGYAQDAARRYRAPTCDAPGVV